MIACLILLIPLFCYIAFSCFSKFFSASALCDQVYHLTDYKQMLEIVGLLVRTYIIPSSVRMGEEHLSEVVDKIFQLMLCILSGLHTYNDFSMIAGCSLQWAPVFDLSKSRYCLQYSISAFGVAF